MPAKSPKMCIDGKWVDSSSGKTFEDHNPFTGDVYANVPAGTAEDARSAIDAAKAASPNGRPHLPPPNVRSSSRPPMSWRVVRTT